MSEPALSASPTTGSAASAAARSRIGEPKGAHERLHVRDFARTTLKPRHRLVVRAVAEALFRDEVGVPVARLDGFAEEVDRFISPASKTLRFGLLVMLEVIRWLPLFLLGKVALFEDLDLDDRVRFLEKLENAKLTPLTLILVANKTFMTVLFFEHEAELAATGYTGADRQRWRTSLPMAPASPANVSANANEAQP
jgi:hypothetical protein